MIGGGLGRQQSRPLRARVERQAWQPTARPQRSLAYRSLQGEPEAN